MLSRLPLAFALAPARRTCDLGSNTWGHIKHIPFPFDITEKTITIPTLFKKLNFRNSKTQFQFVDANIFTRSYWSFQVYVKLFLTT